MRFWRNAPRISANTLAAPESMITLHYWLLAARPKTLFVTITPLIVGGTLAHVDTGTFLWLPWLVALLAAMGIQIGTNLHNDAADFERGTDTPDRLGPQRATAQGWLSPQSVRRGAYSCFAITFLLGIYLAWIGGWPIVALGLVSLACGYAYTGGPRLYPAGGNVRAAFLWFRRRWRHLLPANTNPLCRYTHCRPGSRSACRRGIGDQQLP
jgi:4-hydroxybenzoate polyprenyltransferase